MQERKPLDLYWSK